MDGRSGLFILTCVYFDPSIASYFSDYCPLNDRFIYLYEQSIYRSSCMCAWSYFFFSFSTPALFTHTWNGTGWPLNSQLCRQKSKSTQLSEGYNTLLQQAENNHIPTGSSIPQDGRPLSPPATSYRRKHAVRITFKYLTQVWLRCP